MDMYKHFGANSTEGRAIDAAYRIINNLFKPGGDLEEFKGDLERVLGSKKRNPKQEDNSLYKISNVKLRDKIRKLLSKEISERIGSIKLERQEKNREKLNARKDLQSKEIEFSKDIYGFLINKGYNPDECRIKIYGLTGAASDQVEIPFLKNGKHLKFYSIDAFKEQMKKWQEIIDREKK